MKPMTLTSGALATALVGLFIGATYGCDQPKPKCASGRGDFAAKYTLVSGGPDCAANKGEIVGVNSYSGVGDGQPNLDKASVAIESTTTGTLVDNASTAGLGDKDPTHKAYALGDFAESEPNSDVCHVPTLSPSIQSLPAVAEDEDLGTSDQPATTIKYEWKNLRVFVTAQANGTQMAADLTITQDQSVCQYKVDLLYPAVDCTKKDADGKTVKDPNTKKPLPDDTACAPEANVDAGRPTGSGINPDFPTHCDPDLLLCVVNDNALLLNGKQ